MTEIPYLDEMWGITSGCSPCSPGCDRCWAKRMFGRNLWKCPSCAGRGMLGIGAPHLVHGMTPDGTRSCGETETYWCPDCGGTGHQVFTPTFHYRRLNQPLHWRRSRIVGVSFMGDLFHEAITDKQIDSVFDVMTYGNNGAGTSWNGEDWMRHPLHKYLLLTKRAERMRDYMVSRQRRAEEYADRFQLCPTEDMRNSPAAVWARQVVSEGWPGIWNGVTVCNQPEADEKIPILLDTPAAHRWVSLEPMLGPVDIEPFISVYDEHGEPSSPRCNPDGSLQLSWVILGAETGPGARPMPAEWAESVWHQCKEAGVPFWWKQGSKGSFYNPAMILSHEYPEGV
jgi:protein gp37